VTYILLQVARHNNQSVCIPLWLLLKQAKTGLHGVGNAAERGAVLLSHLSAAAVFAGVGCLDAVQLHRAAMVK
jgi:hypothetical protein